MKGRVFKRGQTWSYVVDVGANSHTARRQQMRGGFATKRDAERALRDLLRSVDHQRYVEPEGRKNGRGGLSPRTVRYVHTIVRKALADAHRWGRVETNVADRADPPRTGGWQTPKFRTWTATEVRRFLGHVHDDRLYAAWLLAVTTGMRRGEPRYSEPKTPRSRRNTLNSTAPAPSRSE